MSVQVGQRVVIRGQQWQVQDIPQEGVISVIGRGLLNNERTATFLEAIDPVVLAEPPALRWTIGQPDSAYRNWKAFHDAFRLTMAHGRDVVTAFSTGRLILEPYQLEPLRKIVTLPQPRLMLADDVGLGKTAEAGLILMELAQRRRAERVLVLCRAGTAPEQWRDEMRRKFGLDFTILDRDRFEAVRRREGEHINPWAHLPRIIASYHFAAPAQGRGTQHLRLLSQAKWDVVIIDEAHHVAEGASGSAKKLHQLARAIADKTQALLLLSATPHDGKPEGFLSLIRLLDPYLVADEERLDYEMIKPVVVRRLKTAVVRSDSTRFQERELHVLDDLEQSGQERQLHEGVLAYADAITELAEQERDILRRYTLNFLSTLLKKRLLSSPNAIYQSLRQRLQKLSGEEVEDATEEVDEEGEAETAPGCDIGLGDEVERIRQLLPLAQKVVEQGDCRAARILHFLKKETAERVLVFSEYRATTEYLCAYLARHGFDGTILHYHGGLADKERASLQERFLNDPAIKVMVATDAASESINLQQGCHIVLHNDLPWNPNRIEQRNGRVDRYGQSDAPQVYILHIPDSFESEILTALYRKIETIRKQLGSVSNALPIVQGFDVEKRLARRRKRTKDAAQQELLQLEETVEMSKAQIATWGGEHLLQGTEFTSEDNARIHLEITDGARGVIPDFTEVEEFTRNSLWLENGRVEGLLEEGVFEITVPLKYQRKAASEREAIPARLHNAVFRRDLAVQPEYKDTDFLSPAHPLVAELLRTMRGRLYDPQFGGRMTFRLTDTGDAGFLFTFFQRYLDGGGKLLEERLEPVFVGLDGTISTDTAADRTRFLKSPVTRNPRVTDWLHEKYHPQWGTAMELALQEAERRLEARAQELRKERAAIGDREWERLSVYLKQRENYLQRKADAEVPKQFSLDDEEMRRYEARIQRIRREKQEIKEDVEARMTEVANLSAVTRDGHIETLGLLLIVPQEWAL